MFAMTIVEMSRSVAMPKYSWSMSPAAVVAFSRNQVGGGKDVEGVAFPAADQRIASGAADQHVGTVAAVDPIGPGTAVDVVVAFAAAQRSLPPFP